ncbi:CPBP family intramembrane metalloprotease [Bradyrhizobium lablabi]|uniref:CPBP family intramembrane glutamic endopeptidase n=1 Tax=Bradyrhizobium lablabi TaxID=722472 RepID=UPI001BACE79E|nr:type II CAAX endopeptidase family protein [Bradyrhizobium lablabi]MBR1124438.1 CPBP family intramembrane metalloprotease [Bradyrhizobium lablabi]
MESRPPEAPGDPRDGRAPAIWWLAVAFIPLFGSQVIRLHQDYATSWLAWDYAGRIVTLAVLAAIPAARSVAFRREQCRISLLEIGAWIAGILLLYRLCQWPQRLINAAFPATVVGGYPHLAGWLYVSDLVFGMALVAVSEEIVFRRLLWSASKPYAGDGTSAVLITSLIFGVYHWWAGVGNVLLAATIGIPLMVMYRRSGALWPVILAHYLVDAIAFA